MAYGAAYDQMRRSGRLALVLGILLAGAIFFLNRNGPHSSDSYARSSVEDRAAPMLSYLSMPFRGIEAFLDTRRSRAQAFAENEELKAELRRLQDVRRERDELSRKLTALSAHIDVPPVEEHKIVVARAVSESRAPFAQAALVNAGRTKGVRAGSAVMSTNGLYGHVLRVGDRSARILRLTDESSRISIKSTRSDARAILAGDDSPRPILRFVDDIEDFRDGDLIVTSGDDGILPEGLQVGTADSEGRVRLSETGRSADWVRIYVRAIIPAPDDPTPDDPNIIMRVIEVTPEPVAETPIEIITPETEGTQP